MKSLSIATTAFLCTCAVAFSSPAAKSTSETESAWTPKVAPYRFQPADFERPLDSRPAPEQLADAIATIRNAIQIQRMAGRDQQAAKMESDLDSLTDASATESWCCDKKANVHAVGIYVGARTRTLRSTANVHVTDRSGPVTLCLCSFESTNWTVTVGEGVTVDRIILAGTGTQQITEPPATALVEGPHANNANPELYNFHPYSFPGGWVGVADKLQRTTGLKLCTQQSVYQCSREPFIVGPDNKEWLAQMQLNQLRPLLRQAIFIQVPESEQDIMTAVFPLACASRVEVRGQQQSFSFATASLFGPYARTMQPIHGRTHQVLCDTDSNFYGMDEFGLFRLNVDTGAVSELLIPKLGSTRAHVPMALDTKRNQLYLWRGGLQSINLASKAISKHRNDNPGIRAITYSRTADCLFAICSFRVEGSYIPQHDVRKYSVKGMELERHPIDTSIPVDQFSGRPQLFSIGERLVVVPNRIRSAGAYNYVVDPHTGKTIFTCLHKPR